MAITLSNEQVNRFINAYLLEVKEKLKNIGGLRLGSNYHKGLAHDEKFITGSVPILDRDPHDTGAGTFVTLDEAKQTSVSRLWGTPTVQINSTIVKRFAGQQNSETLFADFVAREYANNMLKDIYNVALGAAVGAIGANATLVHDASTVGLDYSTLNAGLAKFGDNSQSLKTIVMRGTASHSVIEDASSAKAVENVMGAVINGSDAGLYGKSSFIYDAEALLDGTINNTLALVDGAISIDESEMRDFVFTKTGGANISYSYMVQGGYDVKLLGYSYNQADENVAATKAEIITGANWTKIADDKQTAGVLIKNKA